MATTEFKLCKFYSIPPAQQQQLAMRSLSLPPRLLSTISFPQQYSFPIWQRRGWIFAYLLPSDMSHESTDEFYWTFSILTFAILNAYDSASIHSCTFSVDWAPHIAHTHEYKSQKYGIIFFNYSIRLNWIKQQFNMLNMEAFKLWSRKKIVSFFLLALFTFLVVVVVQFSWT